jgi:chorismate lyase / 3-hydroxybenzoate synthase
VTAVRSESLSRSSLSQASAPAVPAWVTDLLREGQPHDDVEELAISGVSTRVRSIVSSDVALISVIVPRARELDDVLFREVSAGIFVLLQERLGRTSAPYPVRFWNFIPGIVDPATADLNRYMHFNLGRYRGLQAWLTEANGTPHFSRSLPTATGVGHLGSEIAVHVLGLATAGRAVENPRQRPAYEYSERFGPKPPCFSRGMIVAAADGPQLLIGGTASVCGEESVHDGSLDAQLLETLENLAALIRSAGGSDECDDEAPLDRITEARIYCPHAGDLPAVRRQLVRSLKRAKRIEEVRADLCRPELLVEVEAIVMLGRGSEMGPKAT